MTIHVATTKDVKRLYALEKSVFKVDNFALSKHSFYYHVKKNLLLVAKKDEEILGYILVFTYLKIPRIYSLAVSNKARNQGVASLLLSKVVTDFHHLRLEVRKNNKKAIKLYKKFGFIPTKTLLKYYTNQDGILMQK